MENNTLKQTVSKKLIIAVIAAVIALIGIISIMNKPVTIDMNKYISYEVEGYDGYGEASISIDWDAISTKYAKKLKFTKNARKEYGDILEYMDPITVLRNSMYVSLDKYDELLNGDTINYSWIEDKESIDAVKCNLKFEDGSFKANGLLETVKIDLFKDFKESLVTFSGRDGKARASLSEEFANERELYRDDTIIAVLKNAWGTSIISIISDNKEIARISIDINNTYNLSNGDIVTLSLSDTRKLIEHGYAVINSTKEFIVTDRAASYTQKEDVDMNLVDEYVENYVNSMYGSDANTSRDNIVIKEVYAATAKDTYVTDQKFALVISLSYDEHYKSQYFSKDDTLEFVIVLYTPYEDDGLLVCDSRDEYFIYNENIITEYMEYIEQNYILEQIK